MSLSCASNEDDISSTASLTSTGSDLSFVEDLYLASVLLSIRANQLIVVRMNWMRHVEALLHENLFHVKYRMSLSSFDSLLKMLSPALTLNGKYAIMGGLDPISCELMLHCTIRYLAGGSFHDVRAIAVISKPFFYRLVWHTIDCINRCDALAVKLPGPNELDKVRQGFEAISWDGVLNGCIGALDGYLQCIAAPSHKECGNVGAYFSWHYCVYGVNIQAMCDADCHFLFVSVVAPGKTNDSVAI
jgi:hypothetical protein